jgi:hypothetical protein
MAASLNGFGTTLYGKRDFQIDGSYITTEWVIILFIPIIPLRSLRVRYEKREASKFLPTTVDKYSTYGKRMWPNWKQVLSIYSFVIFYAVWSYHVVWAVVSFFPYLEHIVWAIFLNFIGFLIPISIPWTLRYHSKKRALLKT